MIVSCGKPGDPPSVSETASPQPHFEATPEQASSTPSPRAQFANRIWTTSLGKMYDRFLDSTTDSESLPVLARQIADKILSNADQTIAMIAAIRMMNEDLYVTREADDDVLARISMLDQELAKGRQLIETNTLEMIAGRIPFVFLATIPIGSPLVRAEFKEFIKGHGRRTVAWFKNVSRPPAPVIHWRRIKSSEFFTDYEIGKPIDDLAKTKIPLALVQWLKTERQFQTPAEDLSSAEIEATANF